MLHHLADHLLLHGAQDLGVLVVAALLCLPGHDLEANQALEQLIAQLGRSIAGAGEGGLLLDLPLDVIDGDDMVIDAAHHLLRVDLDRFLPVTGDGERKGEGDEGNGAHRGTSPSQKP